MSHPIVIPPCGRKEKPVVLRGIMKDFAEGQLCYVVARRYKGRGPVRLLLHKAHADSFGYGAFGCYIVSPATLMGSSTSDKKAAASKKNGRLGGRPKK